MNIANQLKLGIAFNGCIEDNQSLRDIAIAMFSVLEAHCNNPKEFDAVVDARNAFFMTYGKPMGGRT